MQWLSKLILLIVSLFTVHNAHAQALTKNQLHDATHKIEQKNLLDNAQCSATAVGPHALLTDTHCEVATENIMVDSVDATIVKRIHDGCDHTIYLMDGVRFTAVVHVGESKTIKQGDILFFWGNPDGREDLYREGRVAGFDIFRQVNIILLDVNEGPGDSGAGLFNTSGNLVSTVSLGFSNPDHRGDSFHLEGSFPLMFDTKQLAEAVRF